MSDSSRLSASSNSNAELAKQYRKKYPNDPDYSLFTVHFSAQLEFQAYTGSRVGKHETLQHLELILYSNFLKHLMKHQSKLKEIASSIYREHQRGLTEKLFGEFNKDTPLKTRVINEIHSYAEFMGSSTSTSKTPRRYLFQNNATELQRILAPDYNYRSAVTHVNLSDPFNPIHTTLSYPLFCRVVNTQVHHRDPSIDTNVLKKYNRHDETYKKKYIGHMCTVAETDHEFLLAIISAYGADPRKYPSSVLEMMNDRKFIKELSGGNEAVPEREPEPSSMKSFTDLSRTRDTGTPDIDTNLEVGSTEHLDTDSGSFSSTRKGGGRDNMDQSGNANDIEILSQDEFNKSLEKPWTEYHGTKFAVNIPDNCYLEFKSGFPYPNNREGILKNCLNVLIWDCELNMWDPGTFKIKRLADSFPNHVKQIEQDLLKALPNSSKAQNQDTAYNVMKNNRSLLQLALLPQMNDSNAGSITSSATSIPNDWSPIQSYLPFETFKTLIFKMAKKDSFSPSIFPDIDLEILKLRYVEYMSVNLQNQINQQFLLGVFHAYGHDVTVYPIRVLQLMKQKELLRPRTVLHDVIGGITTSSDAYEQIFENGISIPKELQLIPAPMFDVVTKTSSGGTKDKSNEIPGKSVQPPASTAGAVSNGIKQPPPSVSPAPILPNPVVKQTNLDSPHTIPSSEFFICLAPIWRKFYGERAVDMPTAWYGFFKSQFPQPNNRDGMLDNCIMALIQDEAVITPTNAFKIPLLRDQFPDQVKDITSEFHNPSRTKVQAKSEGWSGIMQTCKSILHQALTKASRGKDNGIPLPFEWDPSFSVFPFPAFVAHIHWHLKTTRDLKDLPEAVWKLRYVEYLSRRLRKPAQLLVGILTAYGHIAYNYPIRVLQILHKRELLDSSKRLCSAIASLDYANTDYMDIFNVVLPLPMSTQPERMQSPATGPLLRTVTPQPHSSRDMTQGMLPTQAEGILPIPAPAKSHTTWNGNNNLSTEELTISSETFFESVLPSWKQFYGEENKKTVPGNWFSRYKSQFPEPNNGNNGILNNCIANLTVDQKNIGEGQVAVISRLPDEFPEAYEDIERNLMQSVPKYPQVIVHSGCGYHLLMWNNKSLLQAALVAPVELNPSSSNGPKNAAAVFQKTDWCPSRSVFPFPAFQAHVKWYLKRNKGYTLELDPEVMKLRFIEYVSLFMVNTNQFLLSVFSAYGPHLLDYPVRVLEILKQRQLLKPGTKLFDVIKPAVQKAYCRIVAAAVPVMTNENLKQANTVVQQSTTSKQIPLTVDCKSKSSASTTASSSPALPKPKSASTPLPGSTFLDWRKECEKALKEIRKDCHIPLDIPEEYFEELYERYSELAGGDLTNASAFRLFILGVWTGSHLMNFKSEGTPEPTSSRPESRPNSASSSFSRSQSESMNERMTVAVAREVTAHAGTGRSRSGSVAESSAPPERSLVSCFPGTGELRIDDAGARLIQSFGSALRQSVEIIHNSFVRAKKLELETLDRIEDEFSGVGMRDFAKELSWRICWLSNEDDIKLTANLIQKLVEKKLISQPYVIDSVRRGVIKNLPELLVKILNVTGRVSSFLAYLFLGEDDFCWFITLTEDLRRDFVPVWMDLFKKTTEVLKRKTSEVAVRELFSRTPGAQDIIG